MLISSLEHHLVLVPFLFSFLSLSLSMRSFSSSLYISSLFLGLAYGQATTLPPPGQPSKQAALGAFNIIGSSLVSAQQVLPIFIIRVPTLHANSPDVPRLIRQGLLHRQGRKQPYPNKWSSSLGFRCTSISLIQNVSFNHLYFRMEFGK